MNIYAPIAEYEIAKQLLIHARASLEVERVPFRFNDGVADAISILECGCDLAFSALRTLRDAIARDPEQLWFSLMWNHGHDIYLHEESPLVAAMVSMCAEQQGVTYEECAKAIADKFDASRLGEDL